MARRMWTRRRALVAVAVMCGVLYITVHLHAGTDTDTGVYVSLVDSLRQYTALSAVTRPGDERDKRLYGSRDSIRNANVMETLPKIKYVPSRRVYDIDCAAVIKGNKKEIKKGVKLMEAKTYRRQQNISDFHYIELTKDCDKFRQERDYRNYILTPEEEAYPVAYSILLYKEVEQAERLLHALYTPHNVFCLHVDMDAPQHVHDAARGVASCLPNVFVASRQEYIVYSGFTRLQADVNCMQDAVIHGGRWKYFINLPSQQFPIKTNAEISKVLQIYNGANDIEGLTGNRRLEFRFKFRYVYKRTQSDQVKPKIYKSNYQRVDPPANVTMVKGSAYGVFSRAFVEWTMQSKVARELLDWMRDVYSPDEYYWATLQYNPGLNAPGSQYYPGSPDAKPWLAVHASWGGVDTCRGKFVRGVCVYGLGDLPALVTRAHLFVNKFHLDYQPLALSCLEEWHRNRTARPDTRYFNETFYRNLPFINKGPPSS